MCDPADPQPETCYPVTSNTKPLLLVVDDDPKFRRTICKGLADSGLRSESASNAEEARTILEGPDAPAFDLILLDVMMPGASGWEFLDAIRSDGNRTPVIFLTARHEVNERVKGLRLGADDYIVKPFEFSELLARIDVVLRRTPKATTIVVGDLTLDPVKRRVDRNGVRIDMSPRELDLLQILADSPEKVFTREELLREVWDISFDPGTNLVNVQIARLRQRLNRHGPPLIETVVGQGYRIISRSRVTGERLDQDE